MPGLQPIVPMYSLWYSEGCGFSLVTLWRIIIETKLSIYCTRKKGSTSRVSLVRTWWKASVPRIGTTFTGINVLLLSASLFFLNQWDGLLCCVCMLCMFIERMIWIRFRITLGGFNKSSEKITKCALHGKETEATSHEQLQENCPQSWWAACSKKPDIIGWGQSPSGVFNVCICTLMCVKSWDLLYGT